MIRFCTAKTFKLNFSQMRLFNRYFLPCFLIRNGMLYTVTTNIHQLVLFCSILRFNPITLVGKLVSFHPEEFSLNFRPRSPSKKKLSVLFTGKFFSWDTNASCRLKELKKYDWNQQNVLTMSACYLWADARKSADN